MYCLLDTVSHKKSRRKVKGLRFLGKNVNHTQKGVFENNTNIVFASGEKSMITLAGVNRITRREYINPVPVCYLRKRMKILQAIFEKKKIK